MTLKTTPIPTRNWKITKDPVSERDLKRKESKQRVDRRIYYLWFHFLKLCLELESIGHIFEKRVGGGKVILGEGKFVKVNRDEYVGWDLDNLMSMKFNEWFYGNNKCDLFNEDGFKYSGRPQYHSLVKKFNVFIRSLATRGSLGGLHPKIIEITDVFYVRELLRSMRKRGLSN